VERHFEQGHSCGQLADVLQASEIERAKKGYRPIVAKGVVFAKRDFLFRPQDVDWAKNGADALARHWPERHVADIPWPGTLIKRGQPVLSVFALSDTSADALRVLRDRVAFVDRWLDQA
jgi:predicted ATP-grasp superfamily ATP-dependent carboligase